LGYFHILGVGGESDEAEEAEADGVFGEMHGQRYWVAGFYFGHLSRAFGAAHTMIRKSPVILRIVDELVAGGQSGQAILRRHFPKGHSLIDQGAETANVFVIKSGIVKISFAEQDKEFILEFMGEGEVLGDLEAIRKVPAVSTVRAISELSVYMMDSASFLDLLARHAAFNMAILETLAVKVANTGTRNARQQLNTLEHNLANLLEVLESERLPCTKQELADYLGITLRSLNRLWKFR
jgi:CRP-like cAMP-binding protein